MIEHGFKDHDPSDEPREPRLDEDEELNDEEWDVEHFDGDHYIPNAIDWD
jgi:hypothetical protein